jgi:putative alpha-1,2-mannosidase
MLMGNEDVGQMSAWFLISALGFCPVDPVSKIYVLGSPLVDQAQVDLGSGKVRDIQVVRRDPSHAYIHGFSINGVAQQRAWFRHSEIADGARLTFQMDGSPHPTFGTGSDHVSPPLQIDADSSAAQLVDPGPAMQFRTSPAEES